MQKAVIKLKMETSAGNPMLVENSTYRLVSQAFTFHVGFGIWGWGVIWNRPVAVTRQIGDGQEESTPVIDVTRIVQLIIFAGGVIGAMLMARAAARDR
jgi:hypothetical protein